MQTVPQTFSWPFIGVSSSRLLCNSVVWTYDLLQGGSSIACVWPTLAVQQSSTFPAACVVTMTTGTSLCSPPPLVMNVPSCLLFYEEETEREWIWGRQEMGGGDCGWNIARIIYFFQLKIKKFWWQLFCSRILVYNFQPSFHQCNQNVDNLFYFESLQRPGRGLSGQRGSRKSPHRHITHALPITHSEQMLTFLNITGTSICPINGFLAAKLPWRLRKKIKGLCVCIYRW